MSYKQNDPCIQKAYEDEMLFVLMARDPFAPLAILEWIKLSLATQSEEKLREAFNCLMEMKRTNSALINRLAYDKTLLAQQTEIPEIPRPHKTPTLPKIYCRCPNPDANADGSCASCGGLIPIK